MISSHEQQRNLALKIAGEIVFSSEPGVAMRGWREKLAVSQVQLANTMGLSASVISDYESGRRGNPGIQFVRRFIETLLEVGKKTGNFIAEGEITSIPQSGILHIEEFPFPINVNRFSKAISGQIMVRGNHVIEVKGWTIIDCEAVMTKLQGWKFLQVFGDTTERALIFTNIKPERTPVTLMRFSLLKPTVLVYYSFSPEEIDITLAKDNSLTLIYSKSKSIDSLIGAVKELQIEVAERTKK